MLPPEPPNITYKDFDPSVEPEHDDVEDEDEDGNPIEISSVEINILIYLYLLESNFAHTAFTLLAESNLPQTSLFQYFNPGYGSANGATGKSKSATNGTPGVGKSPRDGLFGNPSGRIPRGELVRKLWKAVRWEEVERHITPEGQPYKPTCPNPFHLIVPHLCPPGYPSAQSNPTTTPPTWKRQSPSTRAEAFPAPPNEPSTAGPSRRRIAEESDNDKGKRKKRDSTSPRRRIADGSRSKATDDSSETGSKLKRGVNAREKDDENDNSASEGVGRRNKKSRLGGSQLEVKQPDSRSRTRSPANGAASRTRSRQSSVETEEQAGKDDDNDEGNDDENEDEDDEEGDGDMDVTDEAEERERVQEEEEKRQRDDERKARPGWIDERYIGYLREHRDGVSALAFNPKNRDVLVSGSSDGTAKLWDFVTQKSGEGKVLEAARKPTTIAIKTIESNMKAVTCLSWHPDGTVLAVGSLDGTGRLFTPSGQLQGIMSYGRGSIRAIKFSPDGSRILIAKTDFTVALWLLGSSHDQRMLRTFNNHTAEVNDVDWLDEQVFASCANDKKVLIYRASDTRATFTLVGHTDDITRIKWQPKSRPGQPDQERLLASASDDGTVRIWSLPDYPKGPGSVTGSVGSRSVSPMKQRAMDEDEEMLDLGSIKAARVLEVVKESENLRMDSVEWAPGGEIIAAGGQDTTVKLFNALTGELLHVLKGLEEGTGSFAFSPISKGLIAGGGWNGHLMLWDVKTGEVKGEYEFDEDATKQRVRDKPMNLAMKWRDDGEHLVVGLANKEIMLVHTAEVGK